MGKDYTVDCASQQAVCPVGEQVADVEENWGEGSLSVLEGRRSFRIVALGYDRDGRPFLFFCLLPLGSVCGRDRIVQHGGVVGEDLQTGLRGSLEQEGYGSCSRRRSDHSNRPGETSTRLVDRWASFRRVAGREMKPIRKQKTIRGLVDIGRDMSKNMPSRQLGCASSP